MQVDGGQPIASYDAEIISENTVFLIQRPDTKEWLTPPSYEAGQNPKLYTVWSFELDKIWKFKTREKADDYLKNITTVGYEILFGAIIKDLRIVEYDLDGNCLVYRN